MENAFIYLDGTLEEGYIKEFKSVHPACSFKYRPMLLEQRAAMVKASSRNPDPAKAELEIANQLAKHIKEWDLTDKDGNAVPVEAKQMARLKFALFNRLAGIVLYGTEGSDDNPNKQTEDRLYDAELSAISALSEHPEGDLRQEATVKN